MNGDKILLDGLLVLAVDDNLDNLELIKTAFECYGAEVVGVASATEALEIIAQLKPDIILIDLVMPREDGYDLIRQIRSLEAEQGGQIPAIAVTAAADDNAPALSIKAGFQAYVSLPFDLAELVTSVINLIK
jgi:two-component system OmpR family response regulator